MHTIQSPLTNKHTMYSTRQDHFSKTIVILLITATIMLLILPAQSMSLRDSVNPTAVRHKRWTFNTWRLHGRRETADPLASSTNDLYSPMAPPSDDELRYEIDNDNDDSLEMFERLLGIVRTLHEEQNEKNNVDRIHL